MDEERTCQTCGATDWLLRERATITRRLSWLDDTHGELDDEHELIGVTSFTDVEFVCRACGVGVNADVPVRV